jgi:hypothetical protein
VPRLATIGFQRLWDCDDKILTYRVTIATHVCEVRSRPSFNRDGVLEDCIALLVNDADDT